MASDGAPIAPTSAPELALRDIKHHVVQKSGQREGVIAQLSENPFFTAVCYMVAVAGRGLIFLR